MKSKTIILLAICVAIVISFGFVTIQSGSSKTSLTIEKNQKAFNHETKIGLLSEDKL